MLDSQKCRKAILEVERLGSAPMILAKLKQLMQDPKVDYNTICGLIRNDSALTADIIRISNSAIYAPIQPHTNLLSAISAIGLRELERVVNLSISRQFMAKDLASYGISAFDYWSITVSAAILMEKLATLLKLNREEAYTIGILHAIGRVLINQIIEDFRYTIYWDGKMPIEEWERNAVGFDYTEAGALLLKHWKFADEICNTIEWQLTPEKLEKHNSFLGILQFILRALQFFGSGFKREAIDPALEIDPFLTATKMEQEHISNIIEEARNDFKVILETLDLI